MYTNIPTEQGKAVMKWIGDTFKPKDPNLGALLRDLAEEVLNNNYLTFQGKTYKQLEGTAMGTPCAPTYANLFVAAYEHQLIFQEKLEPLFYGRYIDDVLAIVQGSYEDVLQFQAVLNDLHPKLIFDIESSRSSLPFLDCNIMVETSDSGSDYGYLRTTVYQKPLNSYQYIPWSSYHPSAVKLAFIKGELLRYIRLSTRKSDYLIIRHRLFLRLYARGYPIRWLRKAFQCVNWNESKSTSLIDRPSRMLEDSPLVYHSAYNPLWEQLSGAALLRYTSLHWSDSSKLKVLGKSKKPPIRCVHRVRNLGDLLNTANKKTLKRSTQ
jgi:hypothetical protein